jgi:hypothetical protein
MLSLLLISIVESSYLIYMFLFFETSVDFNIFSQGELGKSGLFKHLVGNECGLRICPFGRIAIFFLIGIILARNFVAIPYIYNNCICNKRSAFTDEYECHCISSTRMAVRIVSNWMISIWMYRPDAMEPVA